MNREELTQKIEGACLTWEQDTQAALSRALGGVTFGSASTTVDRWEAIRRAIEVQNDELRKLKARPESPVFAQYGGAEGRRAELAAALGLIRDELVQEGWPNLLARVSKLRTSHPEAEYLARIRLALGVGPRSTWEDVIARIERWRQRYEQLARLWFGLSDDMPAVPSMGNFIRSLETRNSVQQHRQRAEDAAELRQLLGDPALRWDEILFRVRDLASLAKAIEAVANPMRTAGVVERSPLIDKAAP